MNDVDQRIRERAYQIWLDQGRPDGREKDHWEAAKQAIAQDVQARSLVPQQPVPPVTEIPNDVVSTKARKAKPKPFPPKRKTKTKDPAQTGVH